ncbi:hypothetical protein ACMCUP_001021 [Campylobacter jejuni]|nr:hypothetical protein [Campylobacter jejuni]MDN2809580.1 hypothetical protein [Campylobacter jejuni]MDP8332834.1 hypothetical protein [Campylobacter jejuni]
MENKKFILVYAIYIGIIAFIIFFGKDFLNLTFLVFENLGGLIVRHGQISKFKGFSQEKSFYNKIRKEVNTTIDIYTDEDRFKNYLNYSILSSYYKKETK